MKSKTEIYFIILLTVVLSISSFFFTRPIHFEQIDGYDAKKYYSIATYISEGKIDLLRSDSYYCMRWIPFIPLGAILHYFKVSQIEAVNIAMVFSVLSVGVSALLCILIANNLNLFNLYL